MVSCPESVTTAGDLPGTSTLRGSNTAAEETEPFLHSQQSEAQAPRERGGAQAPPGRVTRTAFLECFSLLTDKPSWLHCSHPRTCERSTRDGLQDRNCILVAGMLQLGAIFYQACHCWSHREAGDPGTLSKDLHAGMPDSGTSQGRRGLQSSCMRHWSTEVKRLNSQQYIVF